MRINIDEICLHQFIEHRTKTVNGRGSKNGSTCFSLSRTFRDLNEWKSHLNEWKRLNRLETSLVNAI